MNETSTTFSTAFLLMIALAPMVGAIIAGLFGTGFLGRQVSRKGAQSITILLVGISFVASSYVLYQVAINGAHFNESVYTWSLVGQKVFEIGFLIDPLTAIMMVVVTSVSLMVHIYTIGYMEDDPGYQRFFAYISLFTFAMLMLVMANNMLQLFFGWEGVGLVSYLLIGFWYTKDTAIFANMKAFLINRVGDFGFVLGIGLIFAHAGSMQYSEIFSQAEQLSQQTVTGTGWPLLTAACFCLFVGAMAKSAQVPLHSWLPDSMEGPTPISALIHAATMVTAGIFMVSRFSPLFELAPSILSIIIVIGSIGALFLGILGIIQNDIKRVVAYSTLSQLGYMTVALGASAYPIAIFHLMTHAFFKALLFLGAGSVIIGMHHDQDIRHMGGLRKYMPITWITFLIGTLALVGMPFFSGFYSKEHIIEAAGSSHIWGHTFAYYATLIGVLVTSLYSFRLYFIVFHGKERFPAHDNHHGHDAHGHHGGKPHESPWVVTLPLVLLSIPSVIIGAIAIKPLLFGNYFNGAITISEHHPVMEELAHEWHGWVAYGLHAFTSVPFWLMIAGLVISWYCYLINPQVPAKIYGLFSGINRILENKYYIDWVNENIIARAGRGLGKVFWQTGDKGIIDTGIIGSSTKLVSWVASISRFLQSGYIYHYTFAMIAGVLVLISVFVLVN